MLTVLSDILSFIENIGAWFLYAIVSAINALIAGVASFLQTLLDGISIPMPSPPALPSTFTDILAWVAWFIPIGTISDIIIFYAAAWVMWFIVSIGMRWARAES